MVFRSRGHGQSFRRRQLELFGETLPWEPSGRRVQQESNVLVDMEVDGSFARTSEASYLVEGDQPVAWAASGERRIVDLSVYNAGAQGTGILLEGSAENLVDYSEDFDEWSVNNVTITSSANPAPDGEDDLQQFAYVGGLGSRVQKTVTNSAAATFVFSVWVRSVSGTPDFGLRVVESGVPLTLAVFTATSSWQRVDVQHVSGGNDIQLRIQKNSAPDMTLEIWGAQLEQSAFRSSYIRTAGSTVTRAADELVIDSDDIPQEILTGNWTFNWYPVGGASDVGNLSTGYLLADYLNVVSGDHSIRAAPVLNDYVEFPLFDDGNQIANVSGSYDAFDEIVFAIGWGLDVGDSYSVDGLNNDLDVNHGGETWASLSLDLIVCSGTIASGIYSNIIPLEEVPSASTTILDLTTAGTFSRSSGGGKTGEKFIRTGTGNTGEWLAADVRPEVTAQAYTGGVDLLDSSEISDWTESNANIGSAETGPDGLASGYEIDYTSPTGYISETQTAADFAADTTHRIRFWAKREAGGNNYARIQVYDRSGTQVVNELKLLSTSWQEFSEDFDSGSGATDIEVRFAATATGAILVASPSIVELGDSTTSYMLVEPEAEQLLADVTDLTTASWAKSGVTVTSGEDAPDGTSSAFLLQGLGSFSSDSLEQVEASMAGTISDDTTYTFSVWLRATRERNVTLRITQKDNTTVTESVRVSGVWQRFSVSADVGTGVFSVNAALVGSSSNGTADVQVWLPQLTEGDYMTSPIRDSSRTRAADSWVISAGNIPVEILAATFVFEIAGWGSSAEMSGPTFNLFNISGTDDIIRVRDNANHVDINARSRDGGDVDSAQIQFDPFEVFTVTRDQAGGLLTIAGADAGDGTTDGGGAPWEATADLEISGWAGLMKSKITNG